jgi:hypothetical protein
VVTVQVGLVLVVLVKLEALAFLLRSLVQQ